MDASTVTILVVCNGEGGGGGFTHRFCVGAQGIDPKTYLISQACPAIPILNCGLLSMEIHIYMV